MRNAFVAALFALQCDKPAEPPTTPEPTPPAATTPDPQPAQDPYALPADAPDGSADCDARRKFAIAFLDEIRSAAQQPCEADDECVLVQDGSKCMGLCPVAINRSEQQGFDGARQAVDDKTCATYREDRCPYAGPRCRNMEAKCNAGACETTPADSK